MEGSLEKINAIEKVDKVEITEDSQIEALKALKDVYEERINDLKQSSADYIQSLKRDKKILIIEVCVLSSVLITTLLCDLLVGTIGWLRF